MGETVEETGMDEYAFYDFTGETRTERQGGLLPMPVRLEMEKAVFGGDEVCLDLLIDELRLFLGENPDLWNLYARTLEVLTYLEGVGTGMEGDREASARFLEMGLEANPASLLLRSNYALALQLESRGEEALEQYEVVLADPEGGENPMVRLLAARLYAERGGYLKAYRLLEGMARDLPDDDAFWEFLSDMRELAGVEEDAVLEEQEGKAAEEPVSVCPACGQVLQPGTRFCRKCGKDTEEEAPGENAQPAFCPGCGSRIREGARFCNECGRTL